MLGLLSAGAGAYTLFKDKPAPKDSDLGKSSSKTSGSETRTDSNLRSDRGKEIPVDPQSGKEQQPLSERESKPGKEDPQKHKEEFPGLRKKPKLNLKNKVDDIIRNNSKFANHRRPLINAEALVDKESYNGALEIYKRTKTRIPDEEIQNKIQENIDQIQDHLESDEDEVYRPDRYDGPPIPLGDLVRAIKDISESLGDTIAKGFSNPISIPLSPWDPGAIPGPPPTPEKFPPGPVSYQIVSPIPPEEHIPLPSPGTPTSSGGAGGSGGVAGGGVGTPTPSSGAGSSGGDAGGGVGTPTPSGGTGGSGGGAGGDVGTPTPSGGAGGSGGGAGGGVGTPTPSSGAGSSGGGTAGTYPQSYSEPNAMDLPDDTFFSEEWEKFKDLPLVDRRTGENRRSGTERRAGSKRKDRRQGEDRRKEDLFKLRDEYLKQKEEQKKREREEAGFEAQDSADFDWTEAPARDELPPFLAPVLPKIELIPIRLPDPQDKTIRPEEEETSQTPSSTSQSGEIRLEAPTTSETPEKIPTPLELPKIGLPDPEYQKTGETTPEIPHLAPASSDDSTVADETPEIEVLEGGLEPLGEDVEEDTGSGGDESTGGPKEEEPRMIHGILELKPPEVDDAPFLTLTYDFDKIPHAFKLSKNYSIMEYSYYKYKPMLVKAQEFARRKMLKNALNYYRVIKSQNIPPELRKMINRNIKDITEFMEKYLMAKGG
ncbi:hypothetical protein LEP1GSC107_1954 [Leptospira interrogans serovar Grippotyphosa str. UI 12769]|uniref:hypothetical protein n=1 Tax=Leptospira interrogans TaxID=173 RepID=UPI0002926001|nr:hypothetical protein [Leptospira interrogans]EKO85787.1 hypothetical protein LEP1GSC009_2605 [Leptospira interrogans serovar Grippotyphosa str. Andaman]EKP85664.1 hypothetical protein LEP1GSC020_1317 [Leptospira interrogans serovar Grippotyphosa str. 2006006986]EKR44121.1 hypothetical protein LEP1GSC097_2273 [Leptospira interrogans serovar Grippotyphosa str. UI 08368]EMN84088.1 hypothetical protein LEP1GSC107_1954 [Leptospira interrogans serovar Grippotyphosa str. UI 12769]